MDNQTWPDESPTREWRWHRDGLEPPPRPDELLRKLLATCARRRARSDGPSPSERSAGHTERPAAACS